jgi:hypothetical protein
MAVLMGLIRLIGGRRGRERSIPCRLGPLFEKLVFGGTVLSAAALAISGFTATWILGHSMQGYLLLFHVAVGGVFAFGLTVLAFLWSETYRLERSDPTVMDRVSTEVTQAPGGRFFYWCFLGFGLATAVTALISMTPLFGSDGITTLYDTHRWCALFATLSLTGLVMRR